MNEINPLKTHDFFYTPKIASFYSNELIKNKKLEIIKNKMLSQKGHIISLKSSKNRVNNNNNSKNIKMPILLNNNINVTPNRNIYYEKGKSPKINKSPNQLDINLSNILNNYNKKFLKKKESAPFVSSFNFSNNKYFFLSHLNNITKKNQKEKDINNNILNNYLNILSQNNPNNFFNSKENIESVEWMLYNRQKNKNDKRNKTNINILDEIFNLQQYEEYLKTINNIPILLANNYNSYNNYKKKHSKDYLLFGNNNLKEIKKKSLELKDNKNKNNSFYENDNNKIQKKRKLIKYHILSIPGSHNGIEKVNQDYSLLLPKINDCNNIKIFGVFDGHGTYGDKLSQEICEYFDKYFNDKNLYEDKFPIENKEKNVSNTIRIHKIKRYDSKMLNKLNKKEKNNNNNKEIEKDNSKIDKNKVNILNFNVKRKYKQLTPKLDKKDSLHISRIKRIKNILNNKLIKNDKIKNIYSILSSNNYFHIYNSITTIDKLLHEKYTENKICDGSGTALSFLLIFNDYYKNNNIIGDKSKCENNYNKLISVNLGNTKSILISEDKKIKELNLCHTPCIKEERIRIEKNGGKIDRIDWLKVGPLRVWFQDKKFPGLSITRSLGDFEAEPLGILSIPDIREFDIDEEKVKIVVIGTNGIWEFLTNDKIMDIVLGFYNYEDVEGATNKIIETAGKLWKIKNPNNIPDLTVIVLFFK